MDTYSAYLKKRMLQEVSNFQRTLSIKYYEMPPPPEPVVDSEHEDRIGICANCHNELKTEKATQTSSTCSSMCLYEKFKFYKRGKCEDKKWLQWLQGRGTLL